MPMIHTSTLINITLILVILILLLTPMVTDDLCLFLNMQKCWVNYYTHKRQKAELADRKQQWKTMTTKVFFFFLNMTTKVLLARVCPRLNTADTELVLVFIQKYWFNSRTIKFVFIQKYWYFFLTMVKNCFPIEILILFKNNYWY